MIYIKLFIHAINFYHENRYRHIINTWIKEARFFSYPKMNAEERMKILVQGIGSLLLSFSPL